jgi:serine/threonine protein kinase
MDALRTLGVIGCMTISGILCDMLMTVAHCLKKKWNYVMEFMEGGDMLTVLDEAEQFSEELTQFYAAELTLAVEFLHKCGIIHR